MINFLHHWVYQDIYQPVWPNWVAGIVAGSVLWFWKGRKWLRKLEEHMRHTKEIHEHLGLSKDK